MRHDPDLHADFPRAVVGVGNEYPASFELKLHTHRRGQLLHAAKGVIAVSTPHGAWVAPPERAVWIPEGTPHTTRTVGSVSTQSVMIAPGISASLGRTCRVIGVSPLLAVLLSEAVALPLAYDEEGRDGQVMRLLVMEIEHAPVMPLAVPFPAHSRLATLCQAFLERPDARSLIDDWADALAMNRRTFTRLFRRETGMSFVQWRQQACLAVALPLLAAGERVTSVALDLGYDSPASFSTMFRRALGVPPTRHV
jgi:AraC-like DNA-binding protein